MLRNYEKYSKMFQNMEKYLLFLHFGYQNHHPMKKNYLLLLADILLGLTASKANAQWAVGIKDGRSRTSADRINLGRIDESYSPNYDGDCKPQLDAAIDYIKKAH